MCIWKKLKRVTFKMLAFCLILRKITLKCWILINNNYNGNNALFCVNSDYFPLKATKITKMQKKKLNIFKVPHQNLNEAADLKKTIEILNK